MGASLARQSSRAQRLVEPAAGGIAASLRETCGRRGGKSGPGPAWKASGLKSLPRGYEASEGEALVEASKASGLKALLQGRGQVHEFVGREIRTVPHCSNEMC